MLRYLFSLLAAVVIISTSVWLFHNRKWLFRPNFDRIGGTELVFEIEGDPPSEGLDRLVEVVERRVDPTGMLGILVAVDGERTVSIRVPNGSQHDDHVDLVKRIVTRKGELDFRLLANLGEDRDACTATRERLIDPASTAARTRAAAGGLPPPGPLNKAGKPEFPLTTAPLPLHRYHWMKLSETAARGVRLISGPARTIDPIDLPNVERCLLTGEPFSSNGLQQCLVYAQKAPGTADPSFFVLTRETPTSLRVGTDLIERARGQSLRGRTHAIVQLRLTADGARRMFQLTSNNLPVHARTTGEFRYLATVLDEEVISVTPVYGGLYRDMVIQGEFGKADVDALAAVLQGGVLPVRLKAKPVREREIAAVR